MQIASQTRGAVGALQEGQAQIGRISLNTIPEASIMAKLKGQDFNPNDRPTAKRIRRMVEMQDFRCAMTDLELTPDDANLDHVVPIAAGGNHVMGNVQVVHKVINQMKSTLPKNEFIEWCRRVVTYADNRRTTPGDE
jgi:hypothetical protein